MGIFSLLRRPFLKHQNQLKGLPQKQVMSPYLKKRSNDPVQAWTMPRYRGRDICDWVSEINRSKRDGELDRALSLAIGCMNAMIDAAMRNPDNVMEFYVKQVAVIQCKMGAYKEEVSTVQNWLSLNLPAPRNDYRIELKKRLAKAQERVARSEGRDSSQYHEEWKRLVDLAKNSKVVRPSGVGVSTGRSKAHSGSSHKGNSSKGGAGVRRPRSSSLVPERMDLKAKSFVAVDFETANSSAVSACQIALVMVCEGRVIDRYSTYMQPPCGHDYFEFTHIHGISSEKVVNAPTWLDVSASVVQFVGNLPVWAHNSQFDSKVWRELDEYYGTYTLPKRFYCSMRTSKKIIPGLVNYQLPTVLRECDQAYRLDHHQADSDAEACARIVCALQRLA